MLQSMLFVPTLREIPKDAEVISHKLLLKGGYIKMNAAGIYTYLPLGNIVLQKIMGIIRQELNAIGCSELLMPTLQPKDLWLESGRWDVYGKELMRLVDRRDRDFCLGPTHEEVITSIVRDYVNSYKKLPLALYQIQTKFRDEFRPRFGLMRGREFIMKDLYTFHTDEKDLEVWYQAVRVAYQKIFTRLGINFRIVRADSGQIGGSKSEEFMALSDIGEDTICYSDASDYASNIEHENLPEGSISPDGIGHIKYAKGIEMGHIFQLGTKYSKAMHAEYMDQNQQKHPIIMGCYGIGISRLLMAIAEQHNHEKGIDWPIEVNPYQIHIIPLDTKGTDSYNQAFEFYCECLKNNIEVLFDDRDERPGVKFSDADLIGAMVRVIFGRKVNEGLVEVQKRLEGVNEEMRIDDLKSLL